MKIKFFFIKELTAYLAICSAHTRIYSCLSDLMSVKTLGCFSTNGINKAACKTLQAACNKYTWVVLFRQFCGDGVHNHRVLWRHIGHEARHHFALFVDQEFFKIPSDVGGLSID